MPPSCPKVTPTYNIDNQQGTVGDLLLTRLGSLGAILAASLPAAIHTLEHLMATWFRNNVDIKGDVVYVGPMGCLTGMYVIMSGIPGKYSVEEMRELVIECLTWILRQTKVPGATAAACGNYLLHDLPMCKYYCRKYMDSLQNDFHSEYTKLEITTEDGLKFADA